MVLLRKWHQQDNARSWKWGGHEDCKRSRKFYLPRKRIIANVSVLLIVCRCLHVCPYSAPFNITIHPNPASRAVHDFCTSQKAVHSTPSLTPPAGNVHRGGEITD